MLRVGAQWPLALGAAPNPVSSPVTATALVLGAAAFVYVVLGPVGNLADRH